MLLDDPQCIQMAKQTVSNWLELISLSFVANNKEVDELFDFLVLWWLTLGSTVHEVELVVCAFLFGYLCQHTFSINQVIVLQWNSSNLNKTDEG